MNTLGRAEAIIRDDPRLLAAYMLGPGSALEWPGFDEESSARFLLRFALEGSHGHRQPVFSSSYLAFLGDPAPPFASRLAAYVFLREAALRARFGRDIAAFEAWFAQEGAAKFGLAPLLPAGIHQRHQHVGGLAKLASLPLAAKRMPKGLNLVGFPSGVMGLGEDIRAMAQAALRAGLNVAIVDLPLEGRRASVAAHGWGGLTVEEPLFDTTVFCLPPFEMMRLLLERGPGLFAARRNIGCWPWELPALPPEWGMAFDAVDEIWAISPFLQETYERSTGKPVRHLPPLVEVEETAPANRNAFGLDPTHTVVLAMFDLNSFVARKNPEGAIAAFKLAFPDIGGPERLILKTMNGAAQPDIMRRIAAAVDGDLRITIIDRALPRAETLGLIAAADVLLSMHRSEGFGRIPAEAMLLGVPVVATGWSGVTSYLDSTTGWPVPFALRPVRSGEYPYAAGGIWAEPDPSAAAKLLREVFASPEEAKSRAAAGRRRLIARHSLDAVAESIAKLMGLRCNDRVPSETNGQPELVEVIQSERRSFKPKLQIEKRLLR